MPDRPTLVPDCVVTTMLEQADAAATNKENR